MSTKKTMLRTIRMNQKEQNKHGHTKMHFKLDYNKEHLK